MDRNISFIIRKGKPEPGCYKIKKFFIYNKEIVEFPSKCGTKVDRRITITTHKIPGYEIYDSAVFTVFLDETESTDGIKDFFKQRETFTTNCGEFVSDIFNGISKDIKEYTFLKKPRLYSMKDSCYIPYMSKVEVIEFIQQAITKDRCRLKYNFYSDIKSISILTDKHVFNLGSDTEILKHVEEVKTEHTMEGKVCIGKRYRYFYVIDSVDSYIIFTIYYINPLSDVLLAKTELHVYYDEYTRIESGLCINEKNKFIKTLYLPEGEIISSKIVNKYLKHLYSKTKTVCDDKVKQMIVKTE